MKIKILSALCFSLFVVSCNGSGNTETPAEPVETAPLSKIEVTVGSGSARTLFEAGYDSGVITNLNISEWFIDISQNMKSTEELPISNDLSVVRKTCGIFGPMEIAGNGVERFSVKYEDGMIILDNEDGGVNFKLIKDNSGKVVSVLSSKDGIESESMSLEYNSSGQLVTVIEKYGNVVGDTKNMKTSFVYKNGSISYADQIMTFTDGTVQKNEIELKGINIRNTQGIVHPVLDNSGMLTALSTLDVIGIKSHFLPKTIIAKSSEKLAGPALSTVFNMNYRIGSDGWLENIDADCEFKVSGIFDIRNTIDYAYTFAR